MSFEDLLRLVLPQRPAERLLRSQLGVRITRGAFWSIIGSTASKGLLMLASIGVARILGKDAYGEYGIIRSTFAMFQIFALFGLEVTATRYVAQLRNTDPRRAGRVIALSALSAAATGVTIAGALWVAAPWLAQHTLAAPQLAGPLRIGALLLLLTALNGAQVGVLAGLEAFPQIARVEMVAGVLGFGMVLGGAALGGVGGAVWGLTGSMAVTLTGSSLACRHACRRAGLRARWRGCGREWRILLRYSLPAVLSSVVVAPVNWATGALLVNIPGGYGHMGIYNAALQWRAFALIVPSFLSRAVLPILANLYGERRYRAYRKTLWINFAISSAVALAIVATVLGAAPWIMRAYGTAFLDGVGVLRIVAVTALLMQFCSYMGLFNRSVGAVWWGFGANAVWGLTALVLSWLWVDRGAAGLAFAYLGAYGLLSLLSAAYMAHRLRGMRE